MLPALHHVQHRRCRQMTKAFVVNPVPAHDGRRPGLLLGAVVVRRRSLFLVKVQKEVAASTMLAAVAESPQPVLVCRQVVTAALWRQLP